MERTAQRHDAAPADILALIPARGGSKSVPKKNLRPVGGKPLIAHTIEQAIRSTLITRVIVSTDSEEIAEVARSCQAELPFLRPPALALDDTPDLPVMAHALAWLRDQERYTPRAVVWLRPTCPVRRTETIDRAIRTFLAHPDVDSLRSVCVAMQNPYKMWRIDGAGLLEPVVRLAEGVESWNMPRQQLPKAYWQNGYVEITRPELIAQRGTMSGDRILPFVLEEPCLDIDYEDQLEQVERLMAQAHAGAPRVVAASERFPS